jgi:hypothetical protein
MVHRPGGGFGRLATIVIMPRMLTLPATSTCMATMFLLSPVAFAQLYG